MKLSTRFSVPLVLAASLVSKVSAVAIPEAIALPWAQANPQAYAAANAYADAYAEAVAIAHPDPEAYALAASADDCASISCHASCGLLIIEGQACSQNSENSYSGPYNTTCLCSSGSKFLQYYAPCMDCGWTLWKYYGGYVSSALAACETLSTEPTGTLRCSTTLTDSYSIDTGIQGCSYLGNCPTETSSTAQTTDSPDQTSAAPTSAEPTSAAPTSDAPSSTQAAPSTQQTDPAAPTSEEAPTAPTSSADEPNAPSSNEASAVPSNSNGEPSAPNSDANTSGSPAPGGATSGQEDPSALDPAASSTSAKFSGYTNGTTSTAIVSHGSTTLITVTSCDENKCTEIPSTAQVSIATTTINGVVTSYTTYCPLTTTTPLTTKASTDKQTTKAPEDVTSKVTATTTKTGASTLASTTPVISTFEAVANKLAGSVGAILMALLCI
ncbi:hypothetical protein WICANDRAFT_98115 [Wickerhamomyces anomalus NRRL Y-366-8]|uniref:Uncharacterized protein n=1 Tax=Wickerhamomyces anomalus (strain ATCC 58044 / CBS 1984 / NCYC 433 / NRRL Y-366-8) TaxID=683960 RepID=A0A1E3NUQ1_WICAA|nr:uncharacterized protein WICANDRAFT_98115 [Wickerhamomyces anomalus NRRL Y-366-8]ODQ56858.1 hypothetical protein WICANDRAFT_98115 [Wickerhamomyces anomalus NRRL Y-366-8]